MRNLFSNYFSTIRFGRCFSPQSSIREKFFTLKVRTKEIELSPQAMDSAKGVICQSSKMKIRTRVKYKCKIKEQGKGLRGRRSKVESQMSLEMILLPPTSLG